MCRVVRTRLLLASAALAALTAGTFSLARDDAPKAGTPRQPPAAPKPLSDSVKRGLAYLVAQQLPNGGWSQGEEAAQMRGSGEPSAVANVGDTCIAALALIRAGNTPKEGPYAKNLAKAVEFVA